MTVDRALSIRNPWALLILSGNKLIENRTWDTKWRGTLAVHAGKTVDKFALTAAAEFGIGLDPMPIGYLGVVDLVGTHRATGDCCPIWGEPGVYHWQLENPRLFPEPIPGPGRLGLYRCPHAIQDAIDPTLLRESA
jgi:hypothetical protein